MDLIQFVPEQLLILVAVLWLIGSFLKNTEKIADYYIPFILMVIGIIFSVAIVGMSATAILQGVVCTGVAVLVENAKKQGLEALKK